LIAPLLVAPMLVAGFAFTSQAASAKTIKITCTMVSGNDSSGPTTESGCTNGPSGNTSTSAPYSSCVKHCTAVETWSPSGTTTSNYYSAKLTTGSKAEAKCENSQDTIMATETGKITAGYGLKGKSKAEVCVNSMTGDLSLVPGTKATL
jgi:predicted acyl esterase